MISRSAGAIDEVLERVWGAALDASRAEDMLIDAHECPKCGEVHGHTDEDFYIRKQRHHMHEARMTLERLFAEKCAGGANP